MNTGKQRWVTMAVFEDQHDAEKLATALKHRGYESRAFNDRLLQMFLFLCPPRVTYRAQVRLKDERPAQEFIDTSPAVRVLTQRALRCPDCESLRVQYPQMTRRFITPTILLNLGIIFRVIEHEAYCEHCHFVWHLPKFSPAGHGEGVAGAHGHGA